VKPVLILALLLIAVPCSAIEILIVAANRVNASASAEEQESGLWKRGDVIAVEDNGFSWGDREVLAPASGGGFCRAILSGVTKAQARAYLKRHLDGGGAMLHRSRFYIDVPALPLAVRNALNNTGSWSGTWAAMKPYVIDRTTGAAIP
jgi:hypothetical protein